jgi:hypothetical protein
VKSRPNPKINVKLSTRGTMPPRKRVSPTSTASNLLLASAERRPTLSCQDMFLNTLASPRRAMMEVVGRNSMRKLYEYSSSATKAHR